MFGLGWTELLIIGAVIAFIAGPAGVKKAFTTFRTLQQAKSDLQSGRLPTVLMGNEDASAAENHEQRGVSDA